jgi:hypothetical protein
MSQEEKISKFAPLKSMFLDGTVKRMKDIEDLYPTNIALALGINHSRYVKRLYEPEDFTFGEIDAFAELIGVSPKIVSDIIFGQLSAEKKKNSTK